MTSGTRLLLIGPPGAGKGTQASRLASAFGVPAISTGDIFRANVANETQLGLKVKAILDAMNDALVRGQRIEIRGFGSFSVSHHAPRMGRNPRNGESVAIPQRRVPHFKPGKALREAVDTRTKELLAGSESKG